MPFVLGIDEAGYGPLLGPLVVGASLWQLDCAPDGCDFWKRLKNAVCRETAKKQTLRVPVGDSKEVYNRKRGICTLERSVLAFAAAAGQSWHSLDGLLDSVEFDRATASRLPWYRDLAMPLPLDAQQSAYEGVTERLRASMQESNTICRGLHGWVVSEARFNDRVDHTQNKAAVVIEAVLGLIHWAAQRIGDQDLFVFVDRLGGRANYREMLSTSFPERHLHEVHVSGEESRYRLASHTSDWHVEFCVEGDRRHMCVALASMVAKYVRELLMVRFNDYWLRLKPELQPTAGYRNDAQRFLADIEALIPASGLQLAGFVRAR